MADSPDTKQATPDDATVSADGAVELTETQLETAEGGALSLLGSTAMEGAFKRSIEIDKLGTLASKLCTNSFKY